MEAMLNRRAKRMWKLAEEKEGNGTEAREEKEITTKKKEKEKERASL